MLSNVLVALVSTALAAPLPAGAPPEEPVQYEVSGLGPVELDVEIDPFAYALGGASLHAGLGAGHWRVDLGVFGMDLPAWMHGNEGYEASFAGYGAKLDHFFRAARSGPFVGVGAGWMNIDVDTPSGETLRDGRLGVGARVGWRLDLIGGLYATPWVGVDRTFLAARLDGFEESGWTVFPTVHLGYRAR